MIKKKKIEKLKFIKWIFDFNETNNVNIIWRITVYVANLYKRSKEKKLTKKVIIKKEKYHEVIF